ncbi:hypothetical protein AURDEDRAFT_173582 [Auricularia subglabra TFB-10046 SS5]|nr:hypothetical protein AURDEDRAFT_173582 [Auricularia subglabra TFB-10046 SS5]
MSGHKAQCFTSPIDRLPPEVLGMCFMWLPFRDRIRASHVSKYWRLAAVSLADLWSALRLNHRPKHRDTFSSVLSRAGTLTLDISWNFSGPGAEEVDILEALMPRIRSLYLLRTQTDDWRDSGDVLPEMLLAYAAPALTSLRVVSGRFFRVPSEWGGDGAPLLSEMHLLGFVIAPDCAPFQSLRTFSGRFLDGRLNVPYTDARMLFRLCPALVDVTLFGIRPEDASRLPIGPTPTALSCLSLQSALGRGVDHLAFCEALDFIPQTMSLFGCTAFLAPLILWNRHVHVPYKMSWLRAQTVIKQQYGSEHQIMLTTDADDGPTLTFVVTDDIHAPSISLEEAIPHLRALTHFVCAAEKLKDLLAIHPELPSLQSLTVVLSADRRYGYTHLSLADYGNMRAPQLQTLHIDAQALDDGGAIASLLWLTNSLPRTLTAWLDFGHRRLESVRFYLTGEKNSVRSGLDMGALLVYAETVYVGPQLPPRTDSRDAGSSGDGRWCSS